MNWGMLKSLQRRNIYDTILVPHKWVSLHEGIKKAEMLIYTARKPYHDMRYNTVWHHGIVLSCHVREL